MNQFYPQRRTGSLGCLGMFSILCLLIFSIVEIAAIFRMNPDWFDSHVAVWRPTPYEKDIVFIDDTDPDARAQLLADDPLPPPVVRGLKTSDGIRLLDDRMVQGDYTPSKGLRLETMEGATIEIPAGAIREAARIRVAPVAEVPDRYLTDKLMIVGPCYKLFVGDQEHYRFSRPIRVTVPYQSHLLEGNYPDEMLAICVSEGNGLEYLPTRVDRVNSTLTADVSHCSFIEVGAILTVKGAIAATAMLGGLGAAGVRGNATMNGIWNRATRPGDTTYSTAHFDIIYSTSPDRAPREPFPIKPDKPVAGTPEFVVLVGEYLESIYADLSIVGMPIDDRHKVFLEPLAGDAAGESKLGGPIWITTRWEQKSVDETDRFLRATIAHEMIHVVQRKTLGIYSAHDWWVEMSAAYLADLYWEKKKRPANMIRDFYMDAEDGRLMTTPMDAFGKEHNYAYGTFLRWLEEKGDTVKLVATVNATGAGSIDQFDTALKQQFNKSLTELLGEFALAYHHGDVANGRLNAPKQFNGGTRTQARKQSIVRDDDFILLTRLSPSGIQRASAALNLVQSVTLPKIGPRCAAAMVIHVDQLPEFRKAKLVVDVEPAAGTTGSDLNMQIAVSRTGATFPTGGQLGTFSSIWPLGPIASDKPRGMRVIDGIMAPMGNDHVTLVFYNPSATREVAGPTVRRWALLRPDWVQYAKAGGLDWTIQGPEAELRGVTSPKVFDGYNLYRRRTGDAEFPKDPVKMTTADQSIASYKIDAPDAQDYAWTFAVRDTYGNVGEPAKADASDPFQGTWSGAITLVSGSLEQPATDAFAKANKLRDTNAQTDISKLTTQLSSATTDSDRASIQRRIDEAKNRQTEDKEMLAKVQEVVGGAVKYTEWLARLGLITVELDVRLINGEYSCRVSKVMMQDTGMTEWAPMDRVGHHTLAFRREIDPKTNQPVPLPKGVPPVYLRLHRENEIRDEYFIEGEFQSEQVHYHLRWTFLRTSNTPPSSVLPPKAP